MTDKLQVASVPEQQKTAAADQATSLQDLTALIGRDSRRQSNEYLDETEVPHGGE